MISYRHYYYAHYQVAGIGRYNIKMIASTSNGIRELDDWFEVEDYVPFEIERVGPTRIYPMVDYSMNLVIKANEDYFGDIFEYIPESFEVINIELRLDDEDGVPDYNFE